jgi:hypothetical protein
MREQNMSQHRENRSHSGARGQYESNWQRRRPGNDESSQRGERSQRGHAQDPYEDWRGGEAWPSEVAGQGGPWESEGYPSQGAYGNRGEYGAGPRGYGQGGYGPSGSRRSGYGQGDWQAERAGFGDRGYGQGGRAQAGYGQGDFGQGRYGQGAFGHGGYPQGQGHGRGAAYGQGGYGQGAYGGSYGQAQGPYNQGGEFEHTSQGQGYGQSGPSGPEWGSPYGRAEQQHRGRGPKGYKRSDERLKEDISERLMQDYQIDAGEVSVEVQSGKVTLDGTVPARHMKHMIEDLVDGCPGVQDIDNRVRVARDNDGGTSASDSRTGASSGMTSSTATYGSASASRTGTGSKKE